MDHLIYVFLPDKAGNSSFLVLSNFNLVKSFGIVLTEETYQIMHLKIK